MEKPYSEVIAEIERYIESDGQIDCFADLHDNPLAKAGDWAERLDKLDWLIKYFEQKKAEYSKKLASVKNLEDSKYTFLTTLLTNTGLKEVIGDNRRGLRLQKNSQPKLIFSVPVQGVKYSYVIPSYHVELADQFPEFFSLTSQYVLDAEALKKSIIAGRKVNFADIEYGSHARIV